MKLTDKNGNRLPSESIVTLDLMGHKQDTLLVEGFIDYNTPTTGGGYALRYWCRFDREWHIHGHDPADQPPYVTSRVPHCVHKGFEEHFGNAPVMIWVSGRTFEEALKLYGAGCRRYAPAKWRNLPPVEVTAEKDWLDDVAADIQRDLDSEQGRVR